MKKILSILFIGVVVVSLMMIPAALVGASSGLVGQWLFDEGAGTTASDSSGNSNTGTLTNGPIWASGKFGSALSFDGSNDYVLVADDDTLDITTAITIEAWINPTTLGDWEQNDWKYIVSKRYGAANYGFRLNGQKLEFYYSGSTTPWHVWRSNLTVVSTGSWQHVAVAFTFGSGSVALYVNGTPIGGSWINGDGTEPAMANNHPLRIGALYPGSLLSFDGMIDEVGIWDVALTADEIAVLASGTCVPPPSGMVSWWPGDGDASDIADGNDGTLQNGATFAAGKVGQAFSLDGVDDYVNLGSTQIIGDDTSFTIDAWIKVNSFASDNKQLPIYGEYSSGTNDAKNYLAVGNLQSGLEQRVFFDQFVPTGGSLKSNIQLTPGQWYHVAYTQDGTNRRLYIDGALDSSDSAIETYSGQTPDDIRIGRRGGTATDQRFNGLIDEVEIFDRALSADEIQAIYNAGSAGKCKEIVIEVDIDIKPGSDPNSINPKSKGVIPVAILGSITFDVTDVDVDTLRFGPSPASPAHDLTDPVVYAEHLQDVNDDGFTDLVSHYRTRDTGIALGDTSATLETTGGIPITGTDSVRIVGK